MDLRQKKLIQSAIAAFAALTAVGSLSGCSGKPVECTIEGVPSSPLVTRKGECISLAGATWTPAPGKENQLQPYESYVRCYGVAAAGKNGCGFQQGACAGTAKNPKDKTAWVSIPKTLCEAIPYRSKETDVCKPENTRS